MSSAAAKPHEPSMEDILASIRRIIADDQDGARPAVLAPPGPAESQDPPRVDDGAADEEILDLADIAEPAPAFHAADDHFAPAHVDLDALARAVPDLDLDLDRFERDRDHGQTEEEQAPEPAAAAAESQPARPEPANRTQPTQPPLETNSAQAQAPQHAPTEPGGAGPSARPATGGRQAGEDRLLSTMTDSAVSQAFNMLAHTVFSQNAMTLEDVVKDMLRPLLKDWLDDNLPPLVERLVRAEIERVARGGSRR